MKTLPNVLLIVLDQLRFDALGYSSEGKIETPAIDWIASMGTVFNSAYSPSPTCIPARACLWTGQKPWSTGVLFTGNSAGPHLPGGVMGCNFAHTLPGELVKGGYHSEGIGKMHFFPQRSNMGFSHTLLDESGREEDKNFISDYKEWFLKCNPGHNDITDHGIHWNAFGARPFHADECYHPSNWTVNECLKFLKRKDPTSPFFLNMSFSRPHSPYDPSKYFYDLYYNREDLPEPFASDWSKGYEENESAKSLTGWCGKKSREEIQRARAGYYGSITQTDYQIGKFLTTLNKAKLLDEMLIIFTSDHGDMLQDHNLLRKSYAYEGSAHIPFIIKLPKSLSKGAVACSDVPVSLYDVMPTVLDICGLELPSDMEGISLVGACKGETPYRPYVQGEHIQGYSYAEDNYFLTDGKFKYIYHFKTGRERFFDLRDNKREEKDEIDNPEFAETIIKMRQFTIDDLEKRNSEDQVFVKDGKLVSIAKGHLIASPSYQARLDTSPYKWME